jgi:hypothetical protein
MGYETPEQGDAEIKNIERLYPETAGGANATDMQKANAQNTQDIEPDYKGMDKQYAVPLDFLPAKDPEDLTPNLKIRANWMPAQKDAQKLMDAQQKSSVSAGNILSQSYQINHLFDKSVQSNPAFLKPGAYNAERTNWANTVATVKQMITGLPVDSNVLEGIGINQAMQKLSTRSGFDLARTLGTREAMQVIQQAMTAVANGSMQPEGFKRILYNVEASAHRQVDKFQYLSSWQNAAGHRTLAGAEPYFDKNIGPETKYVDMAEKLFQLDAGRLAASPEQQKALHDQVQKDYGYSPEMYGG